MVRGYFSKKRFEQLHRKNGRISTLEMNEANHLKLKQLENALSSLKGAFIAFSGGMDSGFLALAAEKWMPERYRAVTAVSEFISNHELKHAKKAAKHFGIPLELVHLQLLASPEIAGNPVDRCYHCKKMIFSRLQDELPTDWVLLDGTNSDDLTEHRPGMKALTELGVISPLLNAKIGKACIREILKEWNADDIFDRPPQACLATRIPTGTWLSPKLLCRIEKGEEIVRGLGFDLFRLRCHGDAARLEFPPEIVECSIPRLREIAPELHRLGFRHIAVDIEGYGFASKKGTKHD